MSSEDLVLLCGIKWPNPALPTALNSRRTKELHINDSRLKISHLEQGFLITLRVVCVCVCEWGGYIQLTGTSHLPSKGQAKRDLQLESGRT